MTNTETRNKAATVAEQGAHVAPETAPSKKGTSKKRGAPKAKKSAKGAKAKPAATKKEAKAARTKVGAAEARTNKKAEVIAMMKRAKGAKGTFFEVSKEKPEGGSATLFFVRDCRIESGLTIWRTARALLHGNRGVKLRKVNLYASAYKSSPVSKGRRAGRWSGPKPRG